MLNIQYKKCVGDLRNCADHLALVLLNIFVALLLLGCEQPSKTDTVQPIEIKKAYTSSTAEIISDNKQKVTNTEVDEFIPFASTVQTKRSDDWLGGAPPLNKRASGVNTYYRIKSEKGLSNDLNVTLRFEGITYEDAKVTFKPIDGATFKRIGQRGHWRLKPNVVSEITFNIIVPENTSYLSIYTYQNKQGASRAFSLRIP